ncbi:hypothetical protein UFOVP1246_84 [uncultured Caudovirales phage]|uniref:Terminase-like family n=1 Tax=uncultured Caudovirales phage TaxID=2100421 RepID=A0A6J5R8Q9_9CAUD|nr:hypothetical protein UFOVP1246_84 [uncultured Caudovirales phage]
MSKMVFKRFPRTDGELHAFIRTVWGIDVPRYNVCPDHVAPFDALAEAYFGRTPLSIWRASRGLGGKSFMLGTLSLTEAVTFGVEITVLGGSAAQSMRVHECTQMLWAAKNAPRSLLVKEPTRYETKLRNKSHIRALMASTRSVRGPHPARLRLDEIDEMDLNILESALGQPMPQRGIESQTVCSSTHQYPDGTVTAMIKRAGEHPDWGNHVWCYRESMGTEEHPGWLDPVEVQRKKAIMPKAMWDAEFEMQEPSFEGRAIDEESITYTFDPALGMYKGEAHECIITEPPQEGCRYITGVDWAKERDWTVIRTFRDEGVQWREVAFERVGRISWPSIVARVNERCAIYPGVLVYDNTGLGNVVGDYLSLPKKMVVIPIDMLGRRREVLFNEYISAIEGRNIKCPRIEFSYTEHRYVTSNDLYGSGHPPDSVVAGALAWHARNEGRTMSLPPIMVDAFSREQSPWRF